MCCLARASRPCAARARPSAQHAYNVCADCALSHLCLTVPVIRSCDPSEVKFLVVNALLQLLSGTTCKAMMPHAVDSCGPMDWPLACKTLDEVSHDVSALLKIAYKYTQNLEQSLPLLHQLKGRNAEVGSGPGFTMGTPCTARSCASP